ncbi:glycosyltransferase family 2 protein [Massilia sp. BSC265]|uniref:glycosyltransferase family 2 protein n=1 Tax=Massilia sp. BSC265 TaxID=1549812 RepID=UPI00068A0E4F|nr:glycosyltransferase family 2 protein [Massilia sp. BSC265]
MDTSVRDTVPLLSIAIPTYKRFDLLAETLESVFALHFDFSVEVLVVDNDPSNDALALQEISRFRDHSFVYYKNIENVGMFGNWNQGINLARGKYVTILHDDDLLLPAFAAELNSRLLQPAAEPAPILAFQVAILDQRENRPQEIPKDRVVDAHALTAAPSKGAGKTRIKGTREFFFGNPFCGTLGVVMRRDLALSVGSFDPSWFPIADYEFWCRWVAAIGDIPIVSEKVGLYRMRQNESMVPQTRSAFVTKSRELRSRMISEGVVPGFYSLLLSTSARVQKLAIDRDWLADGERIKRSSALAVFVWRCLVFSLTRLLPHR